MEILLIFLLVMAAGQKKEGPDLSLLKSVADFLTTKDPKTLFDNDAFKNMKIGGMSAAELFKTADSLKEYAALLPDLFQGGLKDIFAPSADRDAGKADEGKGKTAAEDNEFPALSPIAGIADKNIHYALTRYFS